jgi:hypothetical protein
MFLKKADIPREIRAKFEVLGIDAVRSKLDHVIAVRTFDQQDKKEEPLGEGLMASGREMSDWLTEKAAQQTWWLKAGVIVAVVFGLVSVVGAVVSVMAALH